MKPDQLLTPKQVAELLQVQVQTLRVWRRKNTGPSWVTLGSGPQAPVRYSREAVDNYLLRQVKK